jgi:hypothetical protein
VRVVNTTYLPDISVVERELYGGGARPGAVSRDQSRGNRN